MGSCAESSSSAPPARSARRRSTSSRANRDRFERRRPRGRHATRDGSPSRPRGSASADTALGADDAERLVRAVEADVVLNGITGSVGLGPTLAALETGAHARARQQGVAHRRRRPREARGGARARSCPVDSEHSAIAQALRSGTARRGRRLVLTASGGPFRGRTPRRRSRDVTPARGARAPHLGHGPRRHDELVDPRQQGARGHRGAPAVRRAVRPHRRDRASAVDHPLDGRVRRRLDDRPGVAARHAPADLARPRLAGPRRRASASRSTGRRAAHLDLRAARRRGVPGGRAREAGRRGRAAPIPPSSTRRTSRRSPRSTPGAIGYLDILDTVERVVDAHDAGGRAHPRVAGRGRALGARRGRRAASPRCARPTPRA